MNNKKVLPYIIFGVPIVIGLYFVYKAIKNSNSKGQDAPPNYDPNNNGNVDKNAGGGVTPSVAKNFPLKKGSKGGKVIELQRAMLLYDDSILGKYRDDGDFGSTTETALQTILGKKTADSQDDIDAITKKANEKKKTQSTQVQVDNTNKNRIILADQLIAEFKKDPAWKNFYALHRVEVAEYKKTSDGREKDREVKIYDKGEKLWISRYATLKNNNGFILASYSVAYAPEVRYVSFSAYGFEVK